MVPVTEPRARSVCAAGCFAFGAIFNACGATSRTPPTTTASPTAQVCLGASSASAAPSSSSAATESAGVPAPSDGPCDHDWAGNAPDIAIAWSTCRASADWFATRGLPAISLDGKRIAVVVRAASHGRATSGLTMRILDVDADRVVETLDVLRTGENEEPYRAPTPEEKAIVDRRIAIANERVSGFRPMDRDHCAGPLPWPHEATGVLAYDGCVSTPMPAQTIVCGGVTKAGPIDSRTLELTLKTARLRVSLDGEMLPSVRRNVGGWTFRYDDNFTPGGKRPPNASAEPYLASAAVDFDARALVMLVEYCNTRDSMPTVDPMWRTIRLPKR